MQILIFISQLSIWNQFLLRNFYHFFSWFRLIKTFLMNIFLGCIYNLNKFLTHHIFRRFKFYHILGLKILETKFVVVPLNLSRFELIFKAFYYIWFMFHFLYWVWQISSIKIVITISKMSFILIFNFKQFFFKFICDSNLEYFSFDLNFFNYILNYFCPFILKISVFLDIYIVKLILQPIFKISKVKAFNYNLIPIIQFSSMNLIVKWQFRNVLSDVFISLKKFFWFNWLAVTSKV